MKKLGAFFILLTTQTVSVFAGVGETGLDCQKRIAKIVCEVASPVREKDRYTDARKCLTKNTDLYVTKIKKAFGLYPGFIQRRFCSLKKIYIEQSFFGPAWSAPVDEKNPNQFLIGLRKQDLDGGADLEAHASWFERQTFGGDQGSSSKGPLPRFEVKPKKLARETYLSFTLLHELAHSFDYQHRFNVPKNDPGFTESWTNISWNDFGVVKPAFDFSKRNLICLNNCKGSFLDAGTAHLVYAEIFKSGFISQLSSINGMEDFADTFTYFIMTEYMRGNFKIRVNGKEFSINEVLRSPPFLKKRAFIEKTIRQLKE